MDYRRDLLPPALCLALSAAVHGAVLGWRPSEPEPDRSPPQAVELLYLPLPPGAEAAPAPRRAGPVTEKPAARPSSAPDPARPPPRAPPRPEPPPTSPRAAVPKPPPAEVAVPEPAPKPQPQPPPARPLSLAQLMPRPEDLAVEPAGTGPPDPAGEGAREATLSLTSEDPRYRGYLARVQDAVDLSWRWKEALLAAGVPGTVVVRFTLVPDGGVDDVVVERSGNRFLDREAVDAVRRASFPPFPGHWKIRRLRLVAQFDYRFE